MGQKGVPQKKPHQKLKTVQKKKWWQTFRQKRSKQDNFFSTKRRNVNPDGMWKSNRLLVCYLKIAEVLDPTICSHPTKSELKARISRKLQAWIFLWATNPSLQLFRYYGISTLD